jgi:hypothetical protein
MKTAFVTDLYKSCSFPMRPDAIAMSDRCGNGAVTAVRDDAGNFWYRCRAHRGMVNDRRMGVVHLRVPVGEEVES